MGAGELRRPGTAPARNAGCTEIQFADRRRDQGPAALQRRAACSSAARPTFGRDAAQATRIEVDGRPCQATAKGGGRAAAIRRSTRRPGKFTTNAEVDEHADEQPVARGRRRPRRPSYVGKTVIRLKPNALMDVTNYSATGVPTLRSTSRGPTTASSTSRTTAPAPASTRPTPTTTSRPRCGNVYVSGTYSSSLTIAAANDVIIRPTTRRQAAQQVGRTPTSYASTGSDADARADRQQLRARRPQGRRAAGTPARNVNTTNDPCSTDVRIDAAILSLQHSFIVDNYNCGRLGKLTVNGAIAQKYRGTGRHRHGARSTRASSRTTSTTTACATARRRTS